MAKVWSAINREYRRENCAWHLSFAQHGDTQQHVQCMVAKVAAAGSVGAFRSFYCLVKWADV